MNRTAAVLVTASLLVAGVPGAAAISPFPSPGVAAQAGTTDAPSQNETAESVLPGARLSGLVAVQGAEVENEVERRAFGVRIARSSSNASRAAVVAEQVDDLRQRTAEIKAQRQALLEARRNGSISQARFEAEMAALAVRNGAVNTRLNETEAVAADLPEDALAERGVDATAIDDVRNEASEAGGPGAADIARSITGGKVGGGLSVAANATERQSGRTNRPSPPTDRDQDTETDEPATTHAPETEGSSLPTAVPGTVSTLDHPTPTPPTIDRTPVGPGNGAGPDDGRGNGRGPADGFPLGWLP